MNAKEPTLRERRLKAPDDLKSSKDAPVLRRRLNYEDRIAHSLDQTQVIIIVI